MSNSIPVSTKTLHKFSVLLAAMLLVLFAWPQSSHAQDFPTMFGHVLDTIEYVTGNSLQAQVGGADSSITSSRVTGFVLVNTKTDSDVRPLRNGDVINLQDVGKHISIRAETNPGTVGSVRFSLNDKTKFRTENRLPYALAADWRGRYRTWRVQPGDYLLTATPYSRRRAKGFAGNPMSIRFSVIDQAVTDDTTPPTSPQNLMVERQGATGVVLTWLPSQDASGVVNYTVIRNGREIAETRDTTYTDVLTDSGVAVYEIVAADQLGNTSQIVRQEYNPAQLDAPVFTVVEVTRSSDSEITLIWQTQSSTPVEEYAVSRDGEIVATVSETTYTDSNVIEGEIYEYAVSAADQSGGMADSGTLTVEAGKIPAPLRYSSQGVTAFGCVEVIARTVHVFETPSSDNVLGIQGQGVRGIVIGDGEEADRYRMINFERGVDGYVLEDALEPVSCAGALAGVDSIAPTQPGQPRLETATTSSITLSWTESVDQSNVVSYEVYRNGVQTGTTESPDYTDARLEPGTVYFYSVVAVDAAGNRTEETTPVALQTGGTSSGQNGLSVPTVGDQQFVVNQCIAIKADSTNVYDSPIGSRVGTQVGGSLGRIDSAASRINNVRWRQIDFESGSDGWVHELDLISGTGCTQGETSVPGSFPSVDSNQNPVAPAIPTAPPLSIDDPRPSFDFSPFTDQTEEVADRPASPRPARIIFENDFDQHNAGIYTETQIRSDAMVPRIGTLTDHEPKRAHIFNANGNKKLQFKHFKGEYGATNPSRGGVNIRLDDFGFNDGRDRYYDHLCASFEVTFAPNFLPVRGGKWPIGFSTGHGFSDASPNGTPNGTTQGFGYINMWKPAPGSLTNAFYGHSFTYHAGKSAVQGDIHYFTQANGDRFEFSPGTTYHVVNCVEMNDPGESNGAIRVWINGENVLNQQDFLFRQTGAEWSGTGRVFLQQFYGGSEPIWATPVDTYTLFDNIEIFEPILFDKGDRITTRNSAQISPTADAPSIDTIPDGTAGLIRSRLPKIVGENVRYEVDFGTISGWVSSEFLQ